MATSRVKVDIQGIEDFNKRVKELKHRIFPVLAESAKAGADIIRDAAKVKARKKSGAMADGIVSTVTWAKESAPVAFAGAGMDAKKNHIFVKKAAHAQVFRMYHGYDRKHKDPRYEAKQYYYPFAIEYGHGTTPAYPFMRPAMLENRAKVRNAIKIRFKQVIDSMR